MSLGLSGNPPVRRQPRRNALQDRGASVAPNYTAFNVSSNGALSPVPGSTVTLPVGLSPAQARVSRDGRFVFGDNFAIPGTTPGPRADDRPVPHPARRDAPHAPGGPVAAAVGPNVLLGTAVHPTLPVIYGGLTAMAAWPSSATQRKAP